eukprot:gene24700-1378_t
MSMAQLRAALQALPADHPAKLGHETWPCGAHKVTALTFVNGPRNLRSAINHSFKKANPDAPCLIFRDTVKTYSEVAAEISALGAALVNDFSIKAGDRVAISMRNYPEWCIAFMAITSIGAVIVPLNSLWKGAEMTYGLQDSGTKLLFCDGERL